MEQLTKRWKAKRYIADYERKIVHDRLTGRCAFTLAGVVDRGTAVGFVRDTLASAIDWGYQPCPICVPGVSTARLIVSMSKFAKSIPIPPRPMGSMPPPEKVRVPVTPRPPLLVAGNAMSMELLSKSDKDVRAA